MIVRLKPYLVRCADTGEVATIKPGDAKYRIVSVGGRPAFVLR